MIESIYMIEKSKTQNLACPVVVCGGFLRSNTAEAAQRASEAAQRPGNLFYAEKELGRPLSGPRKALSALPKTEQHYFL